MRKKKHKYKVSFQVSEGRFIGKNIVPKDSSFRHEIYDIEAYEDSQLKAILIEMIKKNTSIKYPYIVGINIITKEDLFIEEYIPYQEEFRDEGFIDDEYYSNNEEYDSDNDHYYNDDGYYDEDEEYQMLMEDMG